MPTIDPHIFRAYDIRGKALTQLTEEAALLIGKGFGSVVREETGKEHPRVVVGRDARTHGQQLEAKVTEGLLSTGCNVLQIHETPSPVNYFTICDQELDGGVQVTASHNPKEDNGLKLQLQHAEAHAGDDLQRLRERIERSDFVEGKGSVESYDGIMPYLARMQKMFADAAKGMHVVVDGGNGVAGPTYVSVIENAGAAVTGMYIEPDGNFPNHPADPSKHATLKELQEKVRATNAHVGLAFDGDGDRLGVVDDTGKILSADEILLLFAQDHLKKHPGSPVIFTVSNSGILETEITKWGGKPVMCKVGHSFVEHAMREHASLLGGEQSGHYFLGDSYFSYDDACVAALTLLRIVHASGKKLSELTAAFPHVYQMPELRPHCPDDKKTEIVRAITAHFQKDHEVNTLDGARIDFGDGAWAGIRQSNTSPRLSVCIEARSPEKLRAVEGEVLAHLKTYPEIDLADDH